MISFRTYKSVSIWNSRTLIYTFCCYAGRRCRGKIVILESSQFLDRNVKTYILMIKDWSSGQIEIQKETPNSVCFAIQKRKIHRFFQRIIELKKK